MKTLTPRTTKGANYKYRLFGIIFGALALIIVLGAYSFFYQRASILGKARELEAIQEKTRMAKRQVDLVAQFREDLAAANEHLETIEEGVAQGDPYRWVIRVLNEFQTKYKIKIGDFGPPRAEEAVYMPKVPYKAAQFTINGSAFFHNFGEFLADFENSYPLIRIKRIELDANGAQVDENQEEEKLSFRIEFVVLLKSATPG